MGNVSRQNQKNGNVTSWFTCGTRTGNGNREQLELKSNSANQHQ
jgi:hypothetical protein